MVCVPLCVCGGGGMSIRERNRERQYDSFEYTVSTHSNIFQFANILLWLSLLKMMYISKKIFQNNFIMKLLH